MGNSFGPGHASMCVHPGQSSGLISYTDPERPRSLFSPSRIVEDPDVGGPTFSLDRPTDEIMDEIKSSEQWKSFIKEFDNAKERMERGEGEVDSGEEVENTENSADGTENDKPEDKETFLSNLHKLKEKTGYPYTHCKKALEKNNNNLDQAEKWLEEESKSFGLDKLSKIDKRRSAEGLVAIAWDKQHAAMVEVNSETDFVSNSDKFRELVNLVTCTCLEHIKTINPSPMALGEVMLKKDDLEKLVAEDKQSLSDHVTKTVALLGERLMLRRAALISTEESSQFAVLTHGSESPQFKHQGRFGTVLVYKTENNYNADLQLPKHICQQIIAMNPKLVDPQEKFNKDEALLAQKYIHDNSQTVGEVALRTGLKIQHFVRFERGEPGENPDELGSEPAKPMC